MELNHDAAWKTAARIAAMVEEADNEQDREYFARIRDAWFSLANRCEFLAVSDVTDEQNPVGITAPSFTREND
jgi:hypothetical protein